MNTLLNGFSVLALAASIAAQGGLSTSTGYAVYANAGNGVVDGVPAGTAIGNSGLAIRAADGTSTGVVMAFASTRVRINAVSTSADRAVSVEEIGSAALRTNRLTTAGTSDDPRRGGQASHGLAWVVPARLGTTGTVTVTWSAAASAVAFSSAVVDVNGDGTPEFARRVTNAAVRVSESFRVRAGANGFTIGIETAGQAGTSFSGGNVLAARYDANLAVALRIDPPRCSFTDFGPECAGRLRGVLPSASSPGIGLRLTNAAPRAIAALAIGNRARPIPLPGSRCELLVNPIVTLDGRTDANGSASWQLPTVSNALSLNISFQVVTLDLNGRPMLGSSNGTTLTCR